MSNDRNVSESQFGNNVVVVQGDNNAPINAGSPEEDSSWLEKLSQENTAYHKKRIFESKGPFFYESFRWILDNPDFNKWRNTEKSGVFWIKGDPGKGKTMLLGGIVDDFEKRTQESINLAYFFCQAIDSRINTAAAVIGGLIASFIKQDPDLRSYIRAKYKDDLNKLNGPDRWYILHDIFEKVIQHSTLLNPVCVVDALDECEQEHGCKQLLRLIIETSCRVKWLISSRNITEIERELQEIDSSRRLGLELKENAGYVTESVDLYIDHSVQNIMALQGDGELQTRATNTLKSKANGTFLWVALIIGQLRHTKHRDIEDVLDEMPEGLESLYGLILNRLNKQKDKDAYQILLSTVVAAERPLHLEELLTFISFQWKDYKTTYGLLDIQDLIKDCGSFLSIRDDDKSVNFIHQSVKDYMMGPALGVIFPSGIEYQNYQMFKTSLNAMSRVLKHNIYGLQNPTGDLYRISPPTPDPLAPIVYCCMFWVEHLFRSCESGASQDRIYLKDGKILHKFLKDKFLCWLEALALLRCLEPQGMDALQKLRILLPSSCKRGTNRSHGEQMANSPRKGEESRYRFIHLYKGLYFGACLVKYAYSVFNYYDDNSHIRSFIDDAYHFVHCWKDLMCNHPLHLYYSALVFEDTHSAIATSFQQILQTEFKNAPIPIRLPQRRVSIVRNIELKRQGSIVALVYSPDSSLLCSLSMYGIVSLFRTDIYALERVIYLNRNWSSSNLDRHFLAFSTNSKLLVSISNTGIVQVWAVDCGTQVQKLTLNLSTRLVVPDWGPSWLQEEVIAISKFGELAASTCLTLSGALISVKVWEINTGKCSIVIDQSQKRNISYAFFSPNLRMIAFIDDKVARVYSVQTGKEIHHIVYTTHFKIDRMEADTITARFSPDSKLLALKYGFDTCLWCTETWTMVRRVKCRFPTSLFDFFPDAALSLYGSDEILLESMDTGETLLRFKPHVEGRKLIFSPDWTQSSLFASSSDAAIQIWRAFVSTRAKPFDVQNTLEYGTHTAISPKSKYVAVWDDGGSIQIWSGESGECIQVLQAEGSSWCLPFFSPSCEHVACVQITKGDIQIWNVRTGKVIHLLKGLDVECYYVPTEFSDDSRYIVAGYQTGLARVWCVESGKCLFEHKFNDCNFIGRVAFSPGSKYIATAPCSNADICETVCTWDWRAGQCISRIQVEGKPSYLSTSLAFSLDAKVLAVITESKSSYRSYRRSYGQYKAIFYDVASCACLGHTDISKSHRFPFFDPTKDHIVADGFICCKGSSWKDWDRILRPENYGVRQKRGRGIWVCFGEHEVFQIPGHISAQRVNQTARISDSLLVFLDAAGEVVIIKLPDLDHIEQ